MSHEYIATVAMTGSMQYCKPDGCKYEAGTFLRNFTITAEDLNDAHKKLNQLLQSTCDGQVHTLDRYVAMICSGYEIQGELVESK